MRYFPSQCKELKWQGEKRVNLESKKKKIINIHKWKRTSVQRASLKQF